MVGGEQREILGDEVDPVVDERNELIRGGEASSGEEQDENDRLLCS